MIELSIIIPSYNVEKFVGKTLESLCIPELSGRLEVLVIDDGSTDSTARIAENLCKREPTIFRCIRKPNGGHGSCVNEGFGQMAGRYARVIDGDDMADSKALVRLVSALEKTDADLVIDERTEFSDKTGEETRFFLPQDIRDGIKLDFSAYAEKRMIPYFTIHSLVIKKELVKSIPIKLDEKIFYEDYELALMATAKAETVLFMRNSVYRYRVARSGQSVSAESYVKRYRMLRRVVGFALRYYEAGAFGADRKGYVRASVGSIINTHLNILLVLDKDKARGRRRARGFMLWLKERHPAFAKDAKNRYRSALLLNLLNVGGEGLERLRAMKSRLRKRKAASKS